MMISFGVIKRWEFFLFAGLSLSIYGITSLNTPIFVHRDPSTNIISSQHNSSVEDDTNSTVLSNMMTFILNQYNEECFYEEITNPPATLWGHYFVPPEMGYSASMTVSRTKDFDSKDFGKSLFHSTKFLFSNVLILRNFAGAWRKGRRKFCTRCR